MVLLALKIILLVLGFIWIYKGYRKKIYIWFPEYLKSIFVKNDYRTAKSGTKHIIFLFVDHFEAPLGERMIGQRRILEWAKRYPEIAAKHTDSDGIYPQHTWFYACEKFGLDCKGAEEELKAISKLCKDGFGEIELHLHHHDDTSQSLKQKIEKAKADFAKVGALVTDEENPRHLFGFIHGGWALDNSIIENSQNCCGVNNG